MFQIQRLFRNVALGFVGLGAVACGENLAADAFPTSALTPSSSSPTSSNGFATGTCVASSISTKSLTTTQELNAETETCSAVGYDGREIAAGVQLVGDVAAVVVADTGELPAAGGNLSSSIATAKIHHVLTASAGSSWIVSDTTSTSGHTQVVGLDIRLLGVAIHADVVSSEADATCASFDPSYTGSSTVANLTVNSAAVPVDGSPNQIFDVPGVLHIAINEQTVDSTGMTVSALHISALSLLDTADVFIARSRANVTCSCVASGDDDDDNTPPAPPPVTDDDDDNAPPAPPSASSSSSSSSSSGFVSSSSSSSSGSVSTSSSSSSSSGSGSSSSSSSSSSGGSDAGTVRSGGAIGAKCDSNNACAAGLTCAVGAASVVK